MQVNHLFAEEALELRSIRMFLHDGVGLIKSGGQIYTGEVTVEFCVHVLSFHHYIIAPVDDALVQTDQQRSHGRQHGP